MHVKNPPALLAHALFGFLLLAEKEDASIKRRKAAREVENYSAMGMKRDQASGEPKARSTDRLQEQGEDDAK